MILVLLAAALVSAVTSAYAHESFADVIIILLVVIINAVLGVYQESKAEQAIADAEERIAQLEARMADPDTYKSPDAAQKLAQEHRDAQEALDALYSDWEELSEAVSELP